MTDERARQEAIGKTVAVWRGTMSQKALADAMRSRGHKWSQSTVWSVEAGTRPLRLTEAQDLALLLDESLDSLDGSPLYKRLQRWLHEGIVQLVDEYDGTVEHLRDFRMAHADLEMTIALVESDRDPDAEVVKDLLERARDIVANLTLESALQDSQEQAEHEMERDDMETLSPDIAAYARWVRGAGEAEGADTRDFIANPWRRHGEHPEET